MNGSDNDPLFHTLLPQKFLDSGILYIVGLRLAHKGKQSSGKLASGVGQQKKKIIGKDKPLLENKWVIKS